MTVAKGEANIREIVTNEDVNDWDMMCPDCQDFCHMPCAERLSSNIVRNLFFQKALDSIRNYNRIFVPPSYHEANIQVEKIDSVELEKYM